MKDMALDTFLCTFLDKLLKQKNTGNSDFCDETFLKGT